MALLERVNKGHREFVKILVTFKKEVPLDLLEELKQPVKVSDGSVPRYDYALMVPANTDTSVLPAGMKLYVMKSFAFEGKELTWVKKPVRKMAVAP
jgi:hypothetical protein